MLEAITNTSPLLYLYRIGQIELLPRLFDAIITAPAVNLELLEGSRRGYDVPTVNDYPWLRIKQPENIPSEWLVSDLGRGELEAISLALERPKWIIILDDGLARRIAKAAGLEVWGTLRILLEGKRLGYLTEMTSVVDALRQSGMWISEDIRRRILILAGEA